MSSYFFRGQPEEGAATGWQYSFFDTSTIASPTLWWGLLSVFVLVMILRALLCCGLSGSNGTIFDTDSMAEHNSRDAKVKVKDVSAPAVRLTSYM